TALIHAYRAPRTVRIVDHKQLAVSLHLIERDVGMQFLVAHSKTEKLAKLAADVLPGQLDFALVALRAHGLEPVQLRYFTVQPDGSLHYITADDLKVAEALPAK